MVLELLVGRLQGCPYLFQSQIVQPATALNAECVVIGAIDILPFHNFLAG